MRTHWILFPFLLIFATAGCGSAPIEVTEPAGNPTMETQNPSLPTEGVPTEMYESIPDPLTSNLQNLVDKAKEDLAGRLSISVEQVNYIGVYDVTWPDASLGCPQEGMMYAQVLTPGYLIKLGYGSIQYEYHSGKSTQVVFCENPGPALPGLPDSN